MATSSITDLIIVDSEKLQKALKKFETEDLTAGRFRVNAIEQLEAGRKLLKKTAEEVPEAV
ncbi:hypothetical protein MmiHf6_15760 [Methanimicrococcus hongohii]|uniref:Uncharacterized protein n=1 Tax=Methanimicrococcus hongohii TaxID=3028295 RepID=A0AA96ZUE8_9EURY|nr:hypothetical protein [Methanimicrococcus sp. Hf6]WNY24246.1 hypothetical protein MmiHf6_15760 [Methanimicrococcus sp. Hf6]